jgi:hypothetical protein
MRHKERMQEELTACERERPAGCVPGKLRITAKVNEWQNSPRSG